MAEAYGNQVERWRAKAVGEVVSQTETAATVRATALWCSVGWGYDVWGSVGSASVAGQSSGAREFYASSATGASVETAVASKDAVFERKAQDYAVRCEASVTLQGGYHDGTSAAFVDVVVPARVLVRPGAPSLSAPATVGPSQPVALSWGKASEQGNAAFVRFELWENGTRVYSGAGTSAIRTAPGASAKKVSYELREVHEWFGGEFYTSRAAEVSIDQLSMPGAPKLTASRSQVQVGDKVAFSFAKADSQGNAAFLRFELWENGTRVYSGSGTSAVRTPSDAQGDSISYELREVHGWYGTEVHTAATVRVGVTRQSAPTAPSLASPASGATVTHPKGTVAVSWRHNATDGTAQTGAEVAYSSSQSGPWRVLAVPGSASSASVPVAADGDVYWKARTKGVFDGGGTPSSAWSPWSAVGYFKARTNPVLSLSVPLELNDLPLTVSWGFEDLTGSQTQASVTVSADGSVIASKAVAGSRSVSFSASELPVSSGQVLAVRVEARSTTGLAGAASATVVVNLLSPAPPAVALRYDRDAMAVVVDYAPVSAPGTAATSAIEVARGARLLASAPASRGRVVDPTPPLDGVVEYAVRARAASGATSESVSRVDVPSGGRFALNWGDDLGACAVAAYNADLSESRGVESESFDAAAWDYPVEIYGTHRTHTGALSATALRRDPTRASLAAWKEAAAWGGGYALRMPHAAPFWVSASVDVSEGTGGCASVDVDWEERAYDGVL